MSLLKDVKNSYIRVAHLVYTSQPLRIYPLTDAAVCTHLPGFMTRSDRIKA